MSKFVPTAGMLFYANHIPFKVSHGDFHDMTIKERTIVDRSYQEKILRCVAIDSRSVIATIEFGGFMNETKPRMLNRNEWTFEPVGPSVIAALNLKDKP